MTEQRPTATRLVFSAHDPESPARRKPHCVDSRDYPGYLSMTPLDDFDPNHPGSAKLWGGTRARPARAYNFTSSPSPRPCARSLIGRR